MPIFSIPRQNEFYELFAAAGANALEAARAAESRFRDFPGGTPQARVKELEHEGDRITGELIGLVNSQFVTPFDREDLFTLAVAVDDVTDAIENATELLGLYDVEQPTRQSIEQCGILVAAVELLAQLLGSLKGLHGSAPEIAEMRELVNAVAGELVITQDLGLGMMLWMTQFFPEEDWARIQRDRSLAMLDRMWMAEGYFAREPYLPQVRIAFANYGVSVGLQGVDALPDRVAALNAYFERYRSGDEYDRAAITHVMACDSHFPGLLLR